MRRVGLAPEKRKFTPHVTLARLRDTSPEDVAHYIATHGHFPRLTFTASRYVLYSAKESTGGGPYRGRGGVSARVEGRLGGNPPARGGLPHKRRASRLSSAAVMLNF